MPWGLVIGLLFTAFAANGCDKGEEATQEMTVDRSSEATTRLRGLYDRVLAYYQQEHTIDPRMSAISVRARSSHGDDNYQSITVSGTDFDGEEVVDTLLLSGTATVTGTASFASITQVEPSGLMRGEVTLEDTAGEEIGTISAGLQESLSAGPITLRTGYAPDTGDSVTVSGLNAAGEPIQEVVPFEAEETTTRQAFSAILNVVMQGTSSVDVVDVAGQTILSVSGGQSAVEEVYSYMDLPHSPFEYGDERTEDQWLPGSAPLTPATIPCGEGAHPRPEDWQHPTWRALSFTPPDPHYYSYQFDSTGHGVGSTFVISAFGDVDCDGVLSTFRRMGTGAMTSTGYGSEPGFSGTFDTFVDNGDE